MRLELYSTKINQGTIITANQDGVTTVDYELFNPIIAKAVRLYPIAIGGTRACIKFEIYFEVIEKQCPLTDF